MMVFTISEMTKVYDGRTVLDIPKLEIEDQRIYALLGPNGAGKTTLLNILGFLDPPSGGRMHYLSQPVRFTESELQALRRQVVMVAQHPILFSTSVYKNLEFGLKIRGISSRERERLIGEALELVDMQSFSRAPAHRLSGGETQRVALARALVLAPRVFLCDEPTSNVDIENQQTIINILRRVNAMKKITVLFTTHDRSQAADLAHFTLVLNRGKLVPAIYENIFTAVMKNYGRGKCCVIQDRLVLPLPPAKLESTDERRRVFIDPKRIDLLGMEAQNDNSEDQMHPGRVVQLTEENGKIRAVVDAGIRITVYISAARYQESRPWVGQAVRLRIAPEALVFLE